MRRRNRTGRLHTAPLLVLLLAACGGGKDQRAAAGDTAGDSAGWLATAKKAAARDGAPVVCGPGSGDAVTLAVTDYVKQAQPRPQRFLASVGTDSALPEPAMRAIQDRGPTYIFPGTAQGQAAARAMLHDKGDYTTMLVVLREATRRDTTVTVRVGGHYVGGEEDGRSAAPRRYQAACSAGRWKLAGSAPETSA